MVLRGDSSRSRSPRCLHVSGWHAELRLGLPVRRSGERRGFDLLWCDRKAKVAAGWLLPGSFSLSAGRDLPEQAAKCSYTLAVLKDLPTLHPATTNRRTFLSFN